jgi:hypothetical protein
MTVLPSAHPPNLESAPTDDLLGLTMTDVHLLAGADALSMTGPRDGSVGLAAAQNGARRVAVPGLSLVLDRIGITVLKPDKSVGAVLPWSELTDVSTGEHTIAPGGAPAFLVEVAAGARTHRFLVPSSYDGRLQAALVAVAPRAAGPDPAPPPARPRGRRYVAALVVALVVVGFALALAVTVGLLAFTINYGWLRNWFPNIHQLWIIAINPGSLLVLIFAAWSLFILKRKDSVRLSAVSLFTCFLVGFTILTYFATVHRGPNWHFYWWPSQWPVH